MKVKTGEPVRDMLLKLRKFASAKPDMDVYDYPVKNGMVLIRRETKECMYVKSIGTKSGNFSIMLQGMPGEFREARKKLDGKSVEELLIDWNEVEEMIAWAKRVPTCS